MRSEFGIGFKESWEQALRDVEESGGKPYAIPAGASDHPLGGLGFAGWAYEVAAQERELDVFFDTVVVCSVTGSTQAGMIAGFAALAERAAGPGGCSASTRSAKPVETRDQVRGSPGAPREPIGLERDLRDDEIELDERYHAGDLRHPRRGHAGRHAAGRPDRGDDHRPGLRGQVDGRDDRPGRRGEIARDSTVLYAHLGGQPALNGYSALFS